MTPDAYRVAVGSVGRQPRRALTNGFLRET